MLNLPEVNSNFFLDSSPHQPNKVLEVYDRQGRDLAKIEAAITTHNAGIAGRAAKHNYAQAKMVEMTQFSGQAFRDVAENLGDQSKKASGMYFEEEVKAFQRHLLQLAATHNEGTLRISAKGMADIVALPVLPEPEKPKGFWARLTGK